MVDCLAPPPRFFNTTGPCDPERHYMLPPKERLIDTNLERMVTHQLYWVLHAPRQTGKTTFLLSWAKELNATGQVVAAYVSVQGCQGLPDAEVAMPIIVQAIRSRAKQQGLPIPELSDGSISAQSQLDDLLGNWAKLCAPKPLVVLFDEVDMLEGPALISFMRQLRSGFITRGSGRFPVSVVLASLHDLRDNLVQSTEVFGLDPGSVFLKQTSSSICSFSRDGIGRLFAQRTADCGQGIEAEALDLTFELTCGQPWLVNALFQKCTWDLAPDPATPVTAAHVQAAK
ncbi:MAG: ATP-binding protein, partial [Planctomycetota bacterium]